MKSKHLLFIPTYNCGVQIQRVLNQLKSFEFKSIFDQVIVVDNVSKDDTQKRVSEWILSNPDLPVSLIVNPQNLGLGGSHKVAFRYAKKMNFDFVTVLHGDDQGSLADFLPALKERSFENVDLLLGSRFSFGSRLNGYSFIRILGNVVFNILSSILFLKKISDLGGSGLNTFRVSIVSDENLLSKCSDDLTFHATLLLRLLRADARVRFIPISWREDDQISNVKLISQTKSLCFHLARIRLG